MRFTDATALATKGVVKDMDTKSRGRPPLFKDGGQKIGPMLVSTKQYQLAWKLSLRASKPLNHTIRRALRLGLRRLVWDARHGALTFKGDDARQILVGELQGAVRQHLEDYRGNLVGVVRAAVVDAIAYDGEGGYDLDSLSGADGAIGVIFDHIEADWLQTLVEGDYPL